MTTTATVVSDPKDDGAGPGPAAIGGWGSFFGWAVVSGVTASMAFS